LKTPACGCTKKNKKDTKRSKSKRSIKRSSGKRSIKRSSGKRSGSKRFKGGYSYGETSRSKSVSSGQSA
jgi:hypothetical protein